MNDKETRNILWFDQVGNDDVALVGGKNASLGEMYQHLVPKGIRIPNGFVITARAYREVVNETSLAAMIRETLEGRNTKDIRDLQSRGKKIRAAFREIEFPVDRVA